MATPRTGCSWLLDNIGHVKELPVEFVHEVVLTGTPANNGYASRLGMPEEWSRKRSGQEHFIYMPYPLIALNLIAPSMRPHRNVDNGQRICEDVSQVDYEGRLNVGDVTRRELQHRHSRLALLVPQAAGVDRLVSPALLPLPEPHGLQALFHDRLNRHRGLPLKRPF